MNWNQRTQTCAYDSILTVLSNIYFRNAVQWPITMDGVNPLVQELVREWALSLQYAEFEKVEASRDALQAKLNESDPASFPIDGRHTDMTQLIIKLVEDPSSFQSRYTRKCTNCNATESLS